MKDSDFVMNYLNKQVEKIHLLLKKLETKNGIVKMETRYEYQTLLIRKLEITSTIGWIKKGE